MKQHALKPNEFLPEHHEYIQQYYASVKLLSKQHSNLIMGMKDVCSNYLLSNNAHAEAVGLADALDLVGRSDSDMPCQGTSSFAAQYQSEDQDILGRGDLKGKSFLKIHHYADGFKARVIHKSLLYHEESAAILGITFCGNEISLASMFTMMPNYVNLIDKVNPTKPSGQSGINLGNGVFLTGYEHKVCFLLVHGWGYKEIAELMNKQDGNGAHRNADTIIKTKNRVCQKLGLLSSHVEELKSLLTGLNVHQQIPVALHGAFSGCWQL